MGKLVAFWSPYTGKAKVTSALCAMAGAMGMQYPELDIAISHTQAESIELEERLDYRFGQEEKRELYDKTGISALALNYMQAVLTSEKVKRCAIPLFMKSLYLFPGAGKKGMQEEVVFQILAKHLVKEFSAVFLDLETGRNETSYRFIDAADATIVILPQHPAYWERFYQEEAECLPEKKLYFIIGDYLESSRYGIPYFVRQRKYGVKDKMLGIIPINTGYRDAMIEGRTLDFFLKNQLSEKKEENYEFIVQTKKAANNIRKKILLS